jgi:hypothetical protein
MFFSWVLRRMSRSTPDALTADGVAVYTGAYGAAR